MDRNEKEKLCRYGKLVWDFANGKTADDILISFFNNLQVAFNFSRDFPEKALEQYPTKQSTIYSLSEKENDLFEMLNNHKKILSIINSAFNSSFSNIDEYNPLTLTFTISEMEWERIREDTIIESGGEEKTISIPANEIDAYIEKILAIEVFEQTDLKAEIKEFIKVSHQIENIKPESTNRFAVIELMTKDYEKIIKLHEYVKAIQAKLKTVLLNIMETEQTYESEGFKSILSRYNTLKKRKLIVNDNQQLIEISTFTEDNFLRDLSYSDYEYIFNAPISYCLVEYLKNHEYSGKERISVCPKCNCIFSKSKLNGQQKYCPVCSRKNKMTREENANYQKEYRANPARRKAIAKTKREEKIQHYMANAGKTRKQAEIIVDNEA